MSDNPDQYIEKDDLDATDAARAKAEELGVDLETLTGSGEGGRILVSDVEDAAPADTASASDLGASDPADDVSDLADDRDPPEGSEATRVAEEIGTDRFIDARTGESYASPESTSDPDSDPEAHAEERYGVAATERIDMAARDRNDALKDATDDSKQGDPLGTEHHGGTPADGDTREQLARSEGNYSTARNEISALRNELAATRNERDAAAAHYEANQPMITELRLMVDELERKLNAVRTALDS